MKHDDPRRGLYGQRPSKSADEARREEFRRVWAMSPRERILKALSLGALAKRLGLLDIKPPPS